MKKKKKNCWWRGTMRKVVWRCKKSKIHPKKLNCCQFINGYKIKCREFKEF